MRDRYACVVMVAVMFSLAGCASRAKPPAEEPRLPAQRFELAGDTIHLYDLAGEVRIERGDGSAAVVEVTRVGTDAAMLQVDTGRAGTTATVRVRFPGEKVTTPLKPRGTTRITVAEDGRFGRTIVSGRTVEIARGGGGTRAQANVLARIPPGRAVVLELAVGKATIVGVHGGVRVVSSYAEVTADSVRGTLTLDVADGSVRASSADGALAVTTSTATITVAQATGSRVAIQTDTALVSGSGIEAAHLDVRSRSGRIVLTGIRSPSSRVASDSGQVAFSHAGTADSVTIATRVGDVSLSLVSGLRSLASVRSELGNVTIRVSPSVSAGVTLEGQLRAPTLQLALALLERASDAECVATAGDGAQSPARCIVVRGRLGTGEARIIGHSQRGDVRLAGF